MTNVVKVPSFRKLDNNSIQFYNDLFEVGEDKTTITFAPEGAAYYASWFRRFGFPFEGIDALGFINTVRDINRILWDEEPDVQPSDIADPEERAVWTFWQEGKFEEFNQALLALEEKRKAAGSTNVVPLFGRRQNDK